MILYIQWWQGFAYLFIPGCNGTHLRTGPSNEDIWCKEINSRESKGVCIVPGRFIQSQWLLRLDRTALENDCSCGQSSRRDTCWLGYRFQSSTDTLFPWLGKWSEFQPQGRSSIVSFNPFACVRISLGPLMCAKFNQSTKHQTLTTRERRRKYLGEWLWWSTIVSMCPMFVHHQAAMGSTLSM